MADSKLTFFITGLPRSRTAWFSAFMTACGYPCQHEAINGCRTIKQYKDKIKHTSDSNTAFGFIPPPIDRPILIIHRDGRLGAEYQHAKGRLLKLKGLHVDFNDIDSRIGEIVKYLTGNNVNKDIYDTFRLLNITSNIVIDEESARALYASSN